MFHENMMRLQKTNARTNEMNIFSWILRYWRNSKQNIYRETEDSEMTEISKWYHQENNSVVVNFDVNWKCIHAYVQGHSQIDLMISLKSYEASIISRDSFIDHWDDKILYRVHFYFSSNISRTTFYGQTADNTQLFIRRFLLWYINPNKE